MLANGCALALAIAVATSGCAGTFECLGAGHGSTQEACVASHQPPSRAERAEAKRREAAKAEQKRADEAGRVRDYEAAKQPCAGGSPKACWVVAVHATLYKHDKAEILAALAVACDGKIAQACFELGMAQGDVARLAMGCELGHLRSCQMAIAKDPSRALELDSRACALNDGLACERVATIHAQHGDRAETEEYLKLACRADRKAACQRLGELAAGQP